MYCLIFPWKLSFTIYYKALVMFSFSSFFSYCFPCWFFKIYFIYMPVGPEQVEDPKAELELGPAQEERGARTTRAPHQCDCARRRGAEAKVVHAWATPP